MARGPLPFLFGHFIRLIETSRCHLEVGEAKVSAVAVARDAGYSFDQAMAELRRPAWLAPAEVGVVETTPTPPSAGDSGELGGAEAPAIHLSTLVQRIAEVLAADPGQSDRHVARACGCSPTSVGRVRQATGLGRTARKVIRGGQAYEMRIASGTGPQPEA